MKNLTWSLLIALVFNAQAGPSIWSLEQSPSVEVFNGISAPDNYFSIGVGENGSIVHFVNGDNGTSMNSGTSNELYDVYAVSDQLAMATGEDTVLLWDGSVWQALFTGNTNTPYTGAWITPEQDFIYYQALGSPFDILCPHEIDAVNQGGCRALSSPMLQMCGSKDDIKVIMANGDILHYTNQLGAYNGVDPMLHDQGSPLSLTGVYVPANVCLPGPIKPQEIFAINNTNQFYHFDGDQWNNMGVSIPSGQTLTWLNGSSGNYMVATGFKANGMSGNDGVIWTYNGAVWTEDTNLPVGTPGLTDVAVNIGRVDAIFANGFDLSNRGNNSNAAKVDILAAAEQGQFLHTPDLFPDSVTDLMVVKRLLTPEPIHQGDRITFELLIRNVGTVDAIDFRFLDSYTYAIQIAVDNCGMASYKESDPWLYRDKPINLLAAGDTYSCSMEFDVVGDVGDKIINVATILEINDIDTRDNESFYNRASIQTPPNN